MALAKLGSKDWGFGTAGAEAPGIAAGDATNSSVELEYGTQQEAKDGAGEIKGILFGKKTVGMEVSGYSGVFSPPALGGDVTVRGLTGKAMSSSLDASTEDFAKVTVTGKALASEISGGS
jgi:hypothetical protein